VIRLSVPAHAKALHHRYCDFWLVDGALELNAPMFGLARPRTRQPRKPGERGRRDGGHPTSFKQVIGGKCDELYPYPTATFLQGSLSGQIKSVFKSRETNPQKVTDFKRALANGDCTWDLRPLSKSLIAKLQTLGIEVPATAD
jgi:hypothetical protein